MPLSCFGDRSEDLVWTSDVVWYVDMDDAPVPGLRWRDNPDEEGEQHTRQHANLSFADILADCGRYVSAR